LLVGCTSHSSTPTGVGEYVVVSNDNISAGMPLNVEIAILGLV